jgi:hypothetical protein
MAKALVVVCSLAFDVDRPRQIRGKFYFAIHFSRVPKHSPFTAVDGCRGVRGPAVATADRNSNIVY